MALNRKKRRTHLSNFNIKLYYICVTIYPAKWDWNSLSKEVFWKWHHVKLYMWKLHIQYQRRVSTMWLKVERIYDLLLWLLLLSSFHIEWYNTQTVVDRIRIIFLLYVEKPFLSPNMRKYGNKMEKGLCVYIIRRKLLVQALIKF